MNPKDLQKFLRHNYDIWKYATKGMQEFNCRQCGLCCRIQAITLLPQEYVRLRRKLPQKYFVKIPLGNSYSAPAIKPACPFLDKNNTCRIYKNRPFACRLFPMMLHQGKLPHGLQFIANETCPHIKAGEQYNFNFEKYSWAVQNYAAFADLDRDPTYQKIRPEIDHLPNYTNDRTVRITHTWCSVCRQPFKDPQNHRHATPTKIKNQVEFVTAIGNQFTRKKRQLLALLHQLLNKS